MPDRDLGGLGETKVEEWALHKGIVPNRVHYDKKGWDIFLEFPQAKIANGISYPLDIRPPEISCLVQVKSADKRIGKINHIRLTNWERMVKEQQVSGLKSNRCQAKSNRCKSNRKSNRCQAYTVDRYVSMIYHN